MTNEAFLSDNLDILLLNGPHSFEECFFVGRSVECNFERARLNFSVGFQEGGNLIDAVNFAADDGL